MRESKYLAAVRNILSWRGKHPKLERKAALEIPATANICIEICNYFYKIDNILCILHTLNNNA